jgi:hypothetical protein
MSCGDQPSIWYGPPFTFICIMYLIGLAAMIAAALLTDTSNGRPADRQPQP